MPTSTLNTQLQAINFSLQSIAVSFQHQSFLNSQLFAAIVGAALGLLPFLFLVYKDRPIIKVRAWKAWAVYPGGHPRNALSVSISNAGRRPLNITQVFLKFATGETLVFLNNSSFLSGGNFPVRLEEGSAHTSVIAGGDIAEAVLKRTDYPIAACYNDALGKVYKYKLSKEFWDRFFKNDSTNNTSRP